VCLVYGSKSPPPEMGGGGDFYKLPERPPYSNYKHRGVKIGRRPIGAQLADCGLTSNSPSFDSVIRPSFSAVALDSPAVLHSLFFFDPPPSPVALLRQRRRPCAYARRATTQCVERGDVVNAIRGFGVLDR